MNILNVLVEDVITEFVNIINARTYFQRLLYDGIMIMKKIGNEKIIKDGLI